MNFPPSLISPYFRLNPVTVILDINQFEIVGANQDRIALWFPGFNVATQLTIIPIVNILLNNGFAVSPNTGFGPILFKDVGPLVGANWNAVADAAGGSYTFFEVIYQPKVK